MAGITPERAIASWFESSQSTYASLCIFHSIADKAEVVNKAPEMGRARTVKRLYHKKDKEVGRHGEPDSVTGESRNDWMLWLAEH